MVISKELVTEEQSISQRTMILLVKKYTGCFMLKGVCINLNGDLNGEPIQSLQLKPGCRMIESEGVAIRL